MKSTKSITSASEILAFQFQTFWQSPDREGRRSPSSHLTAVSKLAAICGLCVVVLTLSLLTSNLSAQVPPQRSIRPIGPNLWVAEVPQAVIQVGGAVQSWGRQRKQNWCWAASVQMTLNMAGIRVTQEQVVERIYGSDIDKPGTPQDIINALTGWAPTINGTIALLNPRPLIDDAEMIDDLSLGWPLIVGLRNPDGSGHAEVITAITYSMLPNGAPAFQSVVLRDPWPYNSSRTEISWDEFVTRRSFVIRNRVSFPNGM